MLKRIQARRYLEEVNTYILHGAGEILELPGKISLIWSHPGQQLTQFLSVKAAGSDEILVNGRRCPATEEGLKQGLRKSLSDSQFR
ncbi:MAG: hypothetical protein GX491_18670 [Chloroflexi bacterium]|nr:hypothetical protein [Chloroflexota bacterium]